MFIVVDGYFFVCCQRDEFLLAKNLVCVYTFVYGSSRDRLLCNFISYVLFDYPQTSKYGFRQIDLVHNEVCIYFDCGEISLFRLLSSILSLSQMLLYPDGGKSIYCLLLLPELLRM